MMDEEDYIQGPGKDNATRGNMAGRVVVTVERADPLLQQLERPEPADRGSLVSPNIEASHKILKLCDRNHPKDPCLQGLTPVPCP